jgi:hypothetical protein
MPLTTVQSGMMDSIAQYNSFKNRIINGAMQIDQRNAGAAVTISTANVYCLDRWSVSEASDATFTVQQDSSAPAGFINSAKITVTVADASVAASQYNVFQQRIEGLNCADLGWGTASAATVTLSFWVRSSLTGTFGGAITNSAYNRSYPFTYSISAANTWEQKTITIAGDTSGTWLTTNGIGMTIYFDLGSGVDNTGTANAWVGAGNVGTDSTVQLVNTLNATWQVTGVQLEKGSTATAFDYRPYGTELSLCQRYFLMLGGNSSNDSVAQGQSYTSTACGFPVRFPVTMRTTPTLDTFTASNWSATNGAGALIAATSITLFGGQTSTYGCALSTTVASGLTLGQGAQLIANTSNARLPFNAEL